MTEADWLTAADPQPMLDFLRGKASDRKLRLFVVACCRRIHRLMTSSGITAVNTAERFADGQATEDELHADWYAISYPKADVRRYAAEAARKASCHRGYSPVYGAEAALWAVVLHVDPRHRDRERSIEESFQSTLLRCLFGNPFRPVTFDPAWRTETVVALAAAIYAKRAFDRMPILADALQDAGCDHEDILTHCRSDGPHARGCWVVDLVLGKE